MEQEFYCYYSTQRPIDIRTFPKPPATLPRKSAILTSVCQWSMGDVWRGASLPTPSP